MLKVKMNDEPLTGSKIEEKVRTIKTAAQANKKQRKEADQQLPDRQRTLVAEIDRVHGELREATRLTAAKAVQLGEHLVQLKKAVGHGGWLPFVSEYLPFCERTAARYMNVYKHRLALTAKFDTLSDFQVSEAYEALTHSKPEAPTKRQAPVDDPLSAVGGERGKAEILTGIQRGLIDGLEKLEPVLLEEFERDLLVFKDEWLNTHQPQQEASAQ